MKETFRAALEQAAAARGGEPEVRAAVADVVERLSGGTTATLVAGDDTDRWAAIGGALEALRGRGATAVVWPIGRRWGTALPLGGYEALVAALAAVDPEFDSGARPGTSEDVAHEARLRLSSEALRALDIVLVVEAPEDAVGFSPGEILDVDPGSGVRVLRCVRGGAGGAEGVRIERPEVVEPHAGTDGPEALSLAAAIALAPAPIPVLAAVTGLAPEGVAARLAQAAGPGGPLLVEGGGVTYRDGGWRAAVEASVVAAELGRAHGKFAEAASRAVRGEAPGGDERAYWAGCRAGHLVLSGAPCTAFAELVEPAWEAFCTAVEASPRGRIEDARLARRAAQRAAAGVVEPPAAPGGSRPAGREVVEPGERARAAAFAVRAALVESSLRSRLWADDGPLADSAAAAQLLARWAELVRGAARERLSALSRETARRQPCSARALLAAAMVSPSGERAALIEEALRQLPEEPAERLEGLCDAARLLGGEARGAAEHAAGPASGEASATEALSGATHGLAADPGAEGALDGVLAQALALVSRELLGAFQRATASWPPALCARAVDATSPEHPLRRPLLALLSPGLEEPARAASAGWVARDALAALASGKAWDASIYEDLRRVAPFVSLEVALEAHGQRGLMDAPGSRRVMPALLERLRSLGAPVDDAETSGARQGAQARKKGAGAARARSSQGAAAERATGAAGAGAAPAEEALAARAEEALAVQGPDRMAALAQAALALPPERSAALAELAAVAAEEEPPSDGWGYFLLAQLGDVLSPGRAAQVLGWLLDALTATPLRSDVFWTGDGNDLRRIAPLLLRIGGEALLVEAGEQVAEISARYS
ncbi:uncharacterized protein SOCE26_009490 [Sorangium cellulosum]|uniref:Uncharacterized protein n=1 Tax=Sorangium cellulosum TaxID=56 RepID=A0A2L0EJU2_SORCE|nr:uncharacterized protein SOCE26_009490 [Sorangium cellulosum]